MKPLWVWLSGYNKKKYWNRKSFVQNEIHNSGFSMLKKYVFLFFIKRVDFKWNSSFGTIINGGSQFKSFPILPHGPNGIIVGHDVQVGSNCIIYHQVTIMDGNVIIGNNVTLGAGSKILPNVVIGDDVKIGANCVVVENIPNNATVVLHKPRIIIK